MFIPRTLTETELPGRGAWLRALVVGAILAGAIFAILTVNISTGQAALNVGDVARTDITAPRATSFVSESQTEAARQVAANTALDTDATNVAKEQARQTVEPVIVDVRQGETIVRQGDPITVLDREKLEKLDLTQPRIEATTVAGQALFAALLAV